MAAGVTAGRGLKHGWLSLFDLTDPGGGRRDSRPWIETGIQPAMSHWTGLRVAAGVTAGRGLKPLRRQRPIQFLVAAGVTAGRGLKPAKSWGKASSTKSGGRRDSRPWIETESANRYSQTIVVAAGVTAGRGLKPIVLIVLELRRRGGRRDSRPWIETLV